MTKYRGLHESDDESGSDPDDGEGDAVDEQNETELADKNNLQTLVTQMEEMERTLNKRL